jgi:hypothetical protein
MKTIIKISAALLIAVTFISCGSSSYMVVRERPTSPYYDRPVSPGPGHVWIDGNWYWRGGHYRYRNGYWSVPPPRRSWSPGYWHQTPRGYYWRRGRWHR